MLGKRVLDKTWKMMVQNACECVEDTFDNNQVFQVLISLLSSFSLCSNEKLKH